VRRTFQDERVLGGTADHPIGQYRDYDGMRIGFKKYV